MMNKLRLLFTAPPVPAATPVPELASLFDRMMTCLGTIPDVQLSDDQRRRLNSYLFLYGPLLVFYLARALERTDVFPEYAGEAQRLREETQRADAWLRQRDLFFELGRRCDVQHQLQRGTTVHRAMGILQRLRGEAEYVTNLPQPVLRSILLAPAQRLLSQVYRGVRTGERADPDFKQRRARR